MIVSDKVHAIERRIIPGGGRNLCNSCLHNKVCRANDGLWCYECDQYLADYPVDSSTILGFWPGCSYCNEPSCATCIHQYAWDTYGKPQVCEDCEQSSNFRADDDYCCNCGRPLTEKAREETMQRINKLLGVF